jgi:hypothetical protein
MSATFQLDAAEREAVLARFDVVAKEPRAANQKPVGCLIFALAGIFFLSFPKILHWLRLPPHTETAVGRGATIFLLAVTLLGLRYYFFGDKGFAQAYRRASTALEWFTKYSERADPVQQREYVVDLLSFATSSGGPSLNSTYDVDKARQALGSCLPYAEAVERLLIAERKAWPVFTLEEQVEKEKAKR